MKNIFYILIAVATFSSCQKDIDLDLNSANPSIVIESNYAAEDSTVRVRITKTVNYFGSEAVPTVDNATVTITDQNGVSQSVPFLASGDYILSNYAPQFNTTYSLNVVAEGISYTAISKMASPVIMDPIEFDWFEGGFGFDEGFVMVINFLDPADTVNFYAARFTVNGTVFDRLNEGFTQDDALTDGNYQSRPLFGGPQVDSMDVVGLELLSIDEAIYNYLNEAASIVGGSTSAAPGNPTSNWDNDALGYFSAYSSSREEVTLP
jgi:hypothetical protein